MSTPARSAFGASLGVIRSNTRIPRVAHGRLFEFAAIHRDPPRPPSPYRFLATFEVGDDPAPATDAVRQGLPDSWVQTFAPITERVTNPEAVPPAIAAEPSHIFFVETRPMPGREDEYNHWYTGQHLYDVVQVPGFTAAQRFALAVGGLNNAADPRPGHPYLAIYEMAGDPQAVLEALAAVRASGRMYISPAMDSTTSALVFARLTY